MSDRRPSRPAVNVLIRIVICAGVVLAGMAGMMVLASFKKPPVEVRQAEPSLQVRVVKVQPRDVPVKITGYGELRPVEVVPISAEVAGKVVRIHDRLDVGETISKGEVLFKIDPLNYEAAYRQALANVEQLKQRILRLKDQAASDGQRLKTLQRTKELAQADFQRRRSLFERDKVGSRTAVDSAEQSYNSAKDRADQMAETVRLYPSQIAETVSGRRAAEAAQTLALKNLERCTVRAPFDGRVKDKAVEQGQYVTSGKLLLTLANDAALEIQVPLNSSDARRFLRFDRNPTSHRNGWFNHLQPVDCSIRWTEDPGEHVWKGRLRRVVKFSPETRTLVVAVRVQGLGAGRGAQQGLPLVEGMFCSVEIPGEILKNVFSLPRWAVSFENTVYLFEAGRLKTVSVEVARIQADQALVSGGLKPGQQVVITRLVNPLENSLLEVIDTQGDEGAS